ncbi:MAG: nucleoside triphosphate pyrophosphohydrolase, partial [Myxococcales bacterium]|nr:nucleoside triphosphate pyrophosphohydrolase [Myxococcales bacterium]
VGELREEIARGDRDAAARELGDVLFVAANLARDQGIDPEAALRGTNDRVEARFRYLEARLAEQERTPADASLEELVGLWGDAKAKLA